MISFGNDGVVNAAADAEIGRLAAEWSQVLERLASDLGGISRSTEDEFLAIGGKLQDFYQRGLGVSGLATEMVEEVGGQKVSDATNGLEALLNGMEHYVTHAQQEISESSRTLREILTLLEKVEGPLSGFRKVNKVLRMLGISTKIESARLGQSAAGFDTLASDVGDLSVQVNDKAALILNRKDELSRAIEKTLTGVLESGVEQHDRVIAILAKTRQGLEALTGMTSRCSSSVAGVSAASDQVTGKIGEVVMSMQAHDIVRQQIEHVEEALTELRHGLASGLAGADDAASICELQTAQLRHARTELDQAVRTIIDSLREIASKQASLSTQTSGMAGMADQAGGSFFTEMEKDILVVSGALTESSQVNHSLCVAMGSVADTVGEIATSVGDIEKIGEEIKLIALNAQIKSAYTGEEGAALGVLAEAIQRLSVDAIDHTGAVSGMLQSIIAVTERLTGGVCVDAGGLQSEVSDMIGTLTSLVEALSGVNETLRLSLAKMDEAVTLLSSEIEQVTAGITVHRKVSEVLDRAVEELSGIARDARLLAPASSQAGQLDTLASRYTMESERNIHNALFDQPSEAAPAASQPSADDLGDNVELF